MVSRDPIRGHGYAKTCEHSGCDRITSEHKPYCIDHLSDLPYVKAVQADLARIGEVEARGWKDVTGPFEADVFQFDSSTKELDSPKVSRCPSGDWQAETEERPRSTVRHRDAWGERPPVVDKIEDVS